MSGGNFRLRRPDQINSVSGLAKLWIMLVYNARRYSEQRSGCAGHRWNPPLGKANVLDERAQEGTGRGGGHAVGSPRIAACLVRPPPPPLALARGTRGGVGPLSRLAVGNHTAADHGESGRALLREIHCALAGRDLARAGVTGRRAANVGWPGLLFARAKPPRLR